MPPGRRLEDKAYRNMWLGGVLHQFEEGHAMADALGSGFLNVKRTTAGQVVVNSGGAQVHDFSPAYQVQHGAFSTGPEVPLKVVIDGNTTVRGTLRVTDTLTVEGGVDLLYELQERAPPPPIAPPPSPPPPSPPPPEPP